MQTTTNYGLKKPQDGDNADLKVFVGENMDTIDTKLKQLETSGGSGGGTFGNYEIRFNSTTNTLDFVYIGA